MYKQKYYKYKNKYTKWIKENGLNDPDIGDEDHVENLEYVPDEELDIDRLNEEEIDENLEKMLMKRQNFEGFETDSSIEYVSEDLQQDIFDVGLLGKARGKSFDFGDFDKDEFIQLNKPNKSKILRINNKDSFDTFTEKYGAINKKDKKVHIKWDLVNKDYKGVFIESSALSDRDDTIPFMGRTVPNWVEYDFNHLDEVIIFKKYRNLQHSKEISRPFKGNVVDEYAIDETEFSRITEPITNNKILLIDDIRGFDKFTAKYGLVKTKKNGSFIDINWDNLRIDYDGFYIDKDNNFNEDRYENAFYDGKLYKSWWIKNEIESGVVYLFK